MCVVGGQEQYLELLTYCLNGKVSTEKLREIQRNRDPNKGQKKKKKTLETTAEGVQMVDFTDKDFKAAGTNTFKELKENMLIE